MKYLVLLIAFVMISCGTTKQPAAQTTYGQEVHSVINALLKDQHYIGPKSLVLDELQPIKDSEIEDTYGNMYSGITQKQVQQLLESAKDTTVFQLQTADINGSHNWYRSADYHEMFIPGDYYSGWDALNKKYGVSYYGIISKPIFTEDRTVAVVAISFRDDWRSGKGGTYLLKKVKGKWQCKERISMWVS